MRSCLLVRYPSRRTQFEYAGLILDLVQDTVHTRTVLALTTRCDHWKENKVQYARSSLEALGKIAPGTQPGAVGLELEVRYRAVMYANNTEDKDSGLDWAVKLSEDQSRMEHLDSRGRGVVYHLLLIDWQSA